MSDKTNHFIHSLTSPERQYGEVPFYWWNGSPLSKERLKEQIEMLAEKGLAGVQINYAHINGGGENNLPHGGHGRSIPGSPRQFSDEWWEFFSFAAKECEKHGMSIGMGDYTIAWIGNGYFTDKVASLPDMHAKYLTCKKQMLFTGDENVSDNSVLFIVTYKDFEAAEPVIIYEKGKGVLNPVSGMCEGYIVECHEADNSIDPLNPLSGSSLVDIYFREFERRVPDVKPGTLNYFFQDELMFGVDTKYLWSDSLREGIKEKYGYDIAGFIPHLFYNLGDKTPKIRLDTADVKTEIMENCYFKPVFDYHNERGLIYGCDQSGRGKDPGEFSDYFRTVRWFTAPGNDTPGRAADLIKVKVNSSIAHLYNRPRVWLEGYHSSGWGTTLESITAPTSDNFIFGANLLNLHGLYYSTNGGFFEWAPPDFHFRMPYWDDEKSWLDKYKRLSALLTTGKHFCDCAVYYPVSSHDYGENHVECTDCTFDYAEELFSGGLDFDFIDFQSIEKAKCHSGRLVTETESYKALVFAGVDCIRYSAIKKAKELLTSGGCVVFCGITPYASDRNGKNDSVLKKDIEEILSHPNASLVSSPAEALSFINTKITRSFFPDNEVSQDRVFVHGRENGNDKLFFVRYAAKDSVCRFEAEGNAFILDIEKGEAIKLSGTVAAGGFTFVKMPFDGNKDTLILFTEDDIYYEKEIDTAGFRDEILINDIVLDGYWDFTLIPTLDNRYGDYYMPPSGIIGAEARFFDIKKVNSTEKIPDSFSFYDVPYCTSSALKTVYCSKKTEEICSFISKNKAITEKECFTFENKNFIFEERQIHSRYGYICTDDYTSSLYEQGHHGLKGKIYDDNIYFTDDCVISTFVYSDQNQTAVLSFGNIKPDTVYLNGEKTEEGKIFLNTGKNHLCFCFTYDKELIPDYRNHGHIKRTSVHITKENPVKQEAYLCVPSFASHDYFRLSPDSGEGNLFCFRFKGIPALKSFRISLFGELLSAASDGHPMEIKYEGNGNFGSEIYTAATQKENPDPTDVIFFVKAENGYEYAEIIPEPVTLFSGKGRMMTGDICKTGALKSYSGKLCYEKTAELERLYPDEHFIFETENIGATARLEINGKLVSVFTYSPFRADITDYIVNGGNHIKITVSNTLCNHYSTIPSKYSNYPRDSASGLLSPVHIKVIEYQKGENNL